MKKLPEEQYSPRSHPKEGVLTDWSEFGRMLPSQGLGCSRDMESASVWLTFTVHPGLAMFNEEFVTLPTHVACTKFIEQRHLDDELNRIGWIKCALTPKDK